jgi:hypothetical protein
MILANGSQPIRHISGANFSIISEIPLQIYCHFAEQGLLPGSYFVPKAVFQKLIATASPTIALTPCPTRLDYRDSAEDLMFNFNIVLNSVVIANYARDVPSVESMSLVSFESTYRISG